MEVSKMVPMLFEESPVRVIESVDGKTLFSMPDIANALGHSRQGLRQIIMRNQDVLDGFYDNVTLSYDSRGRGNPKTIVLTEEGLYIVLNKITPSRMKDPEKRKKVIRFQRWVGKTLVAIRMGEYKVFADPRYAPTVYVETGKPLVRDVEWLKELAHLPPYAKGNPERVKAFAESEGVNITTAYKYIQRYQEGGKTALQRQPGNRPDNDWLYMRGRIRAWVLDRPEIRAVELWESFYSDYPLRVIRKVVREARADFAAEIDARIEAIRKK